MRLEGNVNFVVSGTNVTVNGPIYKPSDSVKLAILGGTYFADPSDYIPTGWSAAQTDDETWIVGMKNPLQEGEKLILVKASNMGSLYDSYSTLADTLAAAGMDKARLMLMGVPGDTVKSITIGGDKDIRLDLNDQFVSYKITNNGHFSILDSGTAGILKQTSSGSAVANECGATFTLESGTISGSGIGYSIVQSTKDEFADTIIINGGTITNTVNAQNCVLNTEGDRLIVNGGAIGNKTSGNGINNKGTCEITAAKGQVVLDCGPDTTSVKRSALSSTDNAAVTTVTGTNVVVKGAVIVSQGKIMLAGGTYHSENPSTVATIADGYMVEGTGPWVVREKPKGTIIVVR